MFSLATGEDDGKDDGFDLDVNLFLYACSSVSSRIGRQLSEDLRACYKGSVSNDCLVIRENKFVLPSNGVWVILGILRVHLYTTMICRIYERCCDVFNMESCICQIVSSTGLGCTPW